MSDRIWNLHFCAKCVCVCVCALLTCTINNSKAGVFRQENKECIWKFAL